MTDWITQQQAAEILARLVGRADVFIQNLAPGAAAPDFSGDLIRVGKSVLLFNERAKRKD